MGLWQIIYIIFIAVMLTTNIMTYKPENKSGFWSAIVVYTFLTIVLWRGGFFK